MVMRAHTECLLYHLTLYILSNLFVTESNHRKLSQIILHAMEICWNRRCSKEGNNTKSKKSVRSLAQQIGVSNSTGLENLSLWTTSMHSWPITHLSHTLLVVSNCLIIRCIESLDGKTLQKTVSNIVLPW